MELLSGRLLPVAALTAAAGLGYGCMSERPAVAGSHGAAEVALSSCAEQCRPFGVLHYGFVTQPDGSARLECECMPGEPLPDRGQAEQTPHPEVTPTQTGEVRPPPVPSPTPTRPSPVRGSRSTIGVEVTHL